MPDAQDLVKKWQSRAEHAEHRVKELEAAIESGNVGADSDSTRGSKSTKKLFDEGE